MTILSFKSRLNNSLSGVLRAPDGGEGGGSTTGEEGGDGGGGGFSPSMIADVPVSGLFDEGHELAASPALKDFKNVEGLARSFIDTQRMLGLDRNQLVAIPPEGADEATIQAFHQRMGVPEKPEDYQTDPEVAMAEGLTQDDNFLNAMKLGAKELGLTPAQFTGLHRFYQEYANQQFTQLTETRQTQWEEGERALKLKWGNAYEQNVEMAQLGLREFGSPELVDLLNETGLGNHPAFLEYALAVAGTLEEGDDIPRDGQTRRGGNALTPAQAQAEISSKYSDEAFMKAYQNADHVNHSNAIAQMERLFKQAYPEGQ